MGGNVGANVGTKVGSVSGRSVGQVEGSGLGDREGSGVGSMEGPIEGRKVGCVGTWVGWAMGASVVTWVIASPVQVSVS